jgi:hypothetical protein
MINIFGKQRKRIWDISNKKELASYQTSQEPVVIVGRLSHQKYNEIVNGELEIEIPHGVKMINTAGSRELAFNCDNEIVAAELIEGLEMSGIPWEEDI